MNRVSFDSCQLHFQATTRAFLYDAVAISKHCPRPLAPSVLRSIPYAVPVQAATQILRTSRPRRTLVSLAIPAERATTFPPDPAEPTLIRTSTTEHVVSPVIHTHGHRSRTTPRGRRVRCGARPSGRVSRRGASRGLSSLPLATSTSRGSSPAGTCLGRSMSFGFTAHGPCRLANALWPITTQQPTGLYSSVQFKFR